MDLFANASVYIVDTDKKIYENRLIFHNKHKDKRQKKYGRWHK